MKRSPEELPLHLSDCPSTLSTGVRPAQASEAITRQLATMMPPAIVLLIGSSNQRYRSDIGLARSQSRWLAAGYFSPVAGRRLFLSSRPRTAGTRGVLRRSRPSTIGTSCAKYCDEPSGSSISPPPLWFASVQSRADGPYPGRGLP